MSEKSEDVARKINAGAGAAVVVADLKPAQPHAAPAVVPAIQADATNPFAKPDYCRSCPLFLEPGPVWSAGPEDASMFLVGEAPGAEEVDYPAFRASRFAPFIGGAGRLLSVMLRHADIDRRAVRIGNAVKCRPPNNRTPTDVELAHCMPLLSAELRLAQPNVVVALGETALRATTGRKGIGDQRGVSLEGFDGRKVFPTWHPAFIARARYNYGFATHDLVRAKAQSAFPDVRRLPYDVVRHASFSTDGPVMLRDARERGAITFDFETTGLSPLRSQIVMVGFATRGDKSYVFDWSAGTRKLFQEVLDDPAIEIVGQNILYFDLPFAEGHGIDISKAWMKTFDTMVCFHLANASYGQTSVHEQQSGGFKARGMEKDLSMIASCHTDMEHWKSRNAYATDLVGVCGRDCIATDRSALNPVDGLKAELARYDMLDLYYKHVLPVHPVLHSMTKLGVKIDESRAARWSVQLEKQADLMEAELKLQFDEPWLNLNSPKQLMKLLYEKLKLPVQMIQDQRTRQLKPTANAEALETLAAQFPEHEGLAAVVSVRQFRKLKSTYVDDAMAAGRVHPRFGVSKTATGRLNSWDPNAQNVPEVIREIWVPDDDEHILISGDSSQIEWRLAMVLSADPVGLALLASGVDNHRAIAAEAIGKPISEISDDERTAAKYIVYGLGYGRGAESLAKGVRGSAWKNIPRTELSVDFVRAFIPRFFSRFRAYYDWRERNVAFAREHNYLVNPFKRRRWWYDRGTPTEQYNFPLQSTAADMAYDILVRLDRELPKGATLRVQVHDEYVVHTPKDLAKQTWECLRDVMEQQWPLIVEASASPSVVRTHYPAGWFCPAELGAGTTWKMCKSKDKEEKQARAALQQHLGIGDKA